METKKENEVMDILLQIPEVMAECEMLRLLPFRWASKKPRTFKDDCPLPIIPNCSPKTQFSFSNMVVKFKIRPNAHPQIQNQNGTWSGLDFEKRKRKKKNVVVPVNLNGNNIEKADGVVTSEMASEARKRRMQIVRARNINNRKVVTTTIVQVVPTPHLAL